MVVVTDNVNNILDKPFVKKFDISEFNPEYKTYSDTYYSFDFSVKRYSVLAALNLGFTKIILTDADAVPNKSLFTEDYIMKGFVSNSIQGQVTYNFSQQINTNSELGKRFLSYEQYFNVSYDKNLLDFMPEDCIQFLDIEMPKFYNFLRIWDECIKHKKNKGLSNTPAGNIDEMCFSALHCGLSVGNNSDKCMNALTPIHDKWYDSSFTPTVTEEPVKKRKVILTSIYELFYIKERGEGLYKSFPLLTQTIRNIIFDDYEYIIYTNKSTYEKYNLLEVFPQNNITFKFVELNSEYYQTVLKPIKERRVIEGEIWDRIHSVENYIEVIYNKLEFMLQESIDENSLIVWLDSGLFGTSCSNGWRDYMNEICHTKNFIDKIFEKIETYDFISLLGNSILVNYEIKEKINRKFNTNLKVVPGCLFGGQSKLISSYLENYKQIAKDLIDTLNDYTSEQEILFLCVENKNMKFFEFEDWDDLQRGMLKIMDNYDETKYDRSSCTSYKFPNQENHEIDFNNLDFTQIADIFGIDKGSLHEGHMYTTTYEKYLTKYKDSTPVIVEIGVNDTRFPGGCLKFWDVIYKQMEYYGFDIVDCSNLSYNKNKITIFQGDQNNSNNILEFVYKFNLPNRIDVIIDDGSHISEHILTSFKTFFPFIKKGGLYFIEDLHAGWAEREKTIDSIKSLLRNEEYTEIDESNHKLLIIKK